MGNAISRQNTDDRSSGNRMLPQITTNFHRLKFHSVHGKYIKLSKDNIVARRDEGLCEGIVFSHRPIAINEYICIKIVDTSDTWGSPFRLGFTSMDPTEYRNKLPKCACPYMTDESGNWARALSDSSIGKDSVLFYYVNHNGEVYHGFNNEEKGIFFNEVNTSSKLWALLDIYGDTLEIEFVAHPYSINRPREQHNVRVSHENLNRQIPSSSNRAEVYQRNPEPAVADLCFHRKHGKHVLLKTKKTIKGKIGNNGYAFLNRPLQLDEVVVISVSKNDILKLSLTYGVTSCDPSNINDDLPDNPAKLLDRPEYWVVKKVKGILNLDRLIFSVRSDGALTFRKNFEVLSIAAHVDKTVPLWFFMDLLGSRAEITLLGSYPGSVGDKFINCAKNFLLPERLQSTPSLSLHDDDDDNVCVVCYETRRDCALYRCGHICMCYTCAQKIRKSFRPRCPLCNAKIVDIMKIFK